MFRRTLLRLALPLVLGFGAPVASIGQTELAPAALKIDGFGTLGLAYHDSSGLEYRRNVTQRQGAKGGEIDLDTDSLLGLQAAAVVHEDVQLVVQGLLRSDSSGQWSPRLARAFLRYSPDTTVHMRFGRIGLDVYPHAECLRLDPKAGLSLSALNENDEIGQLVGDINTLVSSLGELLGADAVLRLEQLATRDALTGILNRHGLDTTLAALFARRKKTALDIGLMQIDLDRFKQVNDTHGHEAGDRVLRHAAKALEGCLRRGDIIARQGGDEFVALLIGMDDHAKATEVAEGIIAALQQPIEIGGGHQAHIGASVGIAFAEGPDDTAAALMHRADSAMYSAKRAGRGRAALLKPTVQLGREAA